MLSTRLAHWYGTEALVRAGESERAARDAAYFGERISSSRRYRIPYLRALAVLAHYRGEGERAIEHLQEAGRLAQEIDLPGELWSIRAALAEWYLKQGDKQQAQNNFIEAATMVHMLADAPENEEHRVGFLASPLVQRVLEQGN
jgi:hypothetical protein